MKALPSLKAERAENFPVGLFLLPKKVKEGIHLFYAFARAADNIADATMLKETEKRHLLLRVDEGFEKGHGSLPKWADDYLQLCHQEKYRRGHARDLLSAFLQDTRKSRYTDLNDLLDYCYRSAAPVGRAILEMAGEDLADREASDNLCIALQLLNHLQDCREDYRLRDRIYIPRSWFEQAGVDFHELSSPFPTPELKAVCHRLLDVVNARLKAAAPLAASVHSVSMRWYVSMIYGMACSLALSMRENPLPSHRKSLSRQEMIWCALRELRNLSGPVIGPAASYAY